MTAQVSVMWMQRVLHCQITARVERDVINIIVIITLIKRLVLMTYCIFKQKRFGSGASVDQGFGRREHQHIIN